MFKRIIHLFGMSTLLLAAPTSAQFGMGRKKQGGTFQELQEQAQQGMAAGGGNPMDQLANMDPDEMMKLIQEGMNDPATKQYMEQFGQGMAQVLEQLSSMDPEEMKRQITDNLQQISSPEILNSVLDQQDEVLQSLLMQGLITEEQMLEFQNDPSKFQEQMAQAFDQMSKVLSDPQALDAAMQMMTGMADLMSNPEGAMKKLADAFNSELGDDSKIEEARLQLLADPSAAGNPAMAALFENEDMLEILKDPVKWRDQVRKGQEMLTGGVGAGAGMGEL